MFFIGAKKWPGISKLIEEAGEVLQVCGKLIALEGDILHWDGTNLKERLQDEIADVMAACSFVIFHCGLDREAIQKRTHTKRALFEKWQYEQNVKETDA